MQKYTLNTLARDLTVDHLYPYTVKNRLFVFSERGKTSNHWAS